MGIAAEYTPDPGTWLCAKCQVPLVQSKLQVRYLNSAFDVALPACPLCQQVLVPKSLAEGKMKEVEGLLEDK